MRPGDWVAVGLVAEALVLDVVLIRGGHDTIPSCVRRSFLAQCVTAYLAAHLLSTLPNDPLSRLGDRLGRTVPNGPVP